MTSPDRPTKQQAFLALLKEGWTSLHLDARRPGVQVPAAFKGEAHLVLQYGHDLPIPIPDLEIDDYGVRATLSFSRAAQRTLVPWTAVYAVSCLDGRGVLYSEDIPDDVSVISTRATGDLPASEAAGDDDPGETAVEAPPTRRLRSVPANPEAALPEPLARQVQGVAAEPLARRRRRPQLRLVK